MAGIVSGMTDLGRVSAPEVGPLWAGPDGPPETVSIFRSRAYLPGQYSPPAEAGRKEAQNPKTTKRPRPWHILGASVIF